MTRPFDPAPQDVERLDALRALQIVGTAPEPHFDAVCSLLTSTFGVPTALISLIEHDYQWFKARRGFDQAGTPRCVSFCDHVIRDDAVMVVEDASYDERFSSNPLVTGEPFVRFYAGAPLILAPGIRIGTVCILDTAPRTIGADDRIKLEEFASVVVALLRTHQTNVRLLEELTNGNAKEATLRLQAREVERQALALRESNQQRRVAEAERQRIESETRETALQYRLLAEHSSDMIVRIGLDGTRLFISPACEDLIGFTPDELIGTKPRDSIHPDDVATFEAMHRRLLSGTTEKDSVTNRLKHKDGRWVWVEAHWRAVHAKDGTVAEFVASIRDVGARHEAEERLLGSENLYRTLTDTLPQLIWIVRADNRLAVFRNKGFYAFYGPIGLSREERIGRNHPDDLARMEAAWVKAISAGGTFEVEGRLRRHDGVYRWHKLVGTPVRRQGDIVEWLVSALDIDDIISGRQLLKETSDLLGLSQEAAGAGSFDLDLVTGAAIMSRESAFMHGMACDGEMIETDFETWRACVDTTDASRVTAIMNEACRDHRTYSAEFRVPLSNGEVRWIHGLGRAQYDANGQAVRMLGLNFDITDRKASEAKLIEAIAAADTARHDAEKASAAKSDFLASMSHEIRTPLNSIIGFTDLMLDERRRPEQDQKRLELIRDSGSALLTIVNDILDVAKIEANEIFIDAAPFSIRELIDNTLAIVSGFASARDLTIGRDFDAGLPDRLLGDAGRIRQILLNLLNNAIKFTPAGGVTAIVQASITDWGCHLRCTIKDTGIGIAPDRLERLFKRFSQVDGSISRRFGGTGLGLAISRSLVELMGGEIGVDSVEGQGSSFWFSFVLPVVTEEETIVSQSEPRPSSAMRRILVVDDIDVNRDLARAMLEGSGNLVETASDGTEAVRKVQKGDFDLVFMDIQMPGMDGRTATGLIRQLDGKARDVPIIALSANVLATQVAAFKAAGMNDHVGKPFKRAALQAVVERWANPAPEIQVRPDADVLDQGQFEELREMVGEDTLAKLLVKFRADLRRRLAEMAGHGTRAGVASHAHALISSAGSLGFTTFSALCRQIEQMADGDGDLEPSIAALVAAAEPVVETIGSVVGPEQS